MSESERKPEDKGTEAAPGAGKDSADVGPLTVLASVFRAWFGVQTEANRQRDFSSNNPMPFIVAGVIFTLVMILGVIIAVNLALSGAK